MLRLCFPFLPGAFGSFQGVSLGSSALRRDAVLECLSMLWNCFVFASGCSWWFGPWLILEPRVGPFLRRPFRAAAAARPSAPCFVSLFRAPLLWQYIWISALQWDQRMTNCDRKRANEQDRSAKSGFGAFLGPVDPPITCEFAHDMRCEIYVETTHPVQFWV